MAAEAQRFGHATAAAAGQAARAAGVGRLLLTHFRGSLFVDPEALGDEASAACREPVALATDLGVVTI
jgi:ribonuclease BN (tRNA processing enzyme)